MKKLSQQCVTTLQRITEYHARLSEAIRITNDTRPPNVTPKAQLVIYDFLKELCTSEHFTGMCGMAVVDRCIVDNSDQGTNDVPLRSEERRVGKEHSIWWTSYS